ncbi:DNA-binding transcriptional LysR family regulator [Streptomyces sp. SAI-208]|uniref:LysR family transcriptional regulator n=1 Tax=Streptomyces sp. SAI-208 TaxID=2940550 RepID=UPI002476AA39|nr:LysR family transcriptional regulator [Streptomyces sp. SAI-208]MDH6604797.1 DNA-binding transcriptional LysR family regulator [Streptomyces sp. SAI-208]
MDLRQMEYAVAIADELNFTRAAARCRIGQSGLSHQITQLEREVGALLFERTSRSVRVTQAGQIYVACARRVLKAVQEMHAEISSLDGPVRGRLRIGSVTLTAGNIDQLGLLREFQEAYPAVEVTLFDSDGVHATSQLLTGELEVAVVAVHEHQLPPGIAYHLLSVVPLVAVVGRRHRLRGAGVIGLAELADERFLECVPDTGLRAQVDAAFDRARARRRGVCALRSAGDLVSLAFEDIGVTVVPRPAADAIIPADHADCVLRLDDPQALQPLALVHRDPAPASPAAQAFLRLALTRLPGPGAPGLEEAPAPNGSGKP